MIKKENKERNEKRSPKIPWKLLNFLLKGLLIVIIALALFGGVKFLEQEFISENKTLKLNLADIGELATQTAYVTEVQTLEKKMNLFDIDIPFTGSKLIFSYDVLIKAGYDFAEIKLERIDTHKKEVIITLPPCKILAKDLNPASFKLYHEQKNVFTAISLKETNESYEELLAAAEKKAIENGILTEARKNAQILLKNQIINSALNAQIEDLAEFNFIFRDQQ